MPQISVFTSLNRCFSTITITSNGPIKQYLSTLLSRWSVREIKQIHAHLVTTNQIKDTFTATKMVESYAVRAANIDLACQVFTRIEFPDSYSWTTMIRGFVHVKNPDKAIEVYGFMRAKEVELNRFTFLFLLKAYGLKPSYKETMILHGKLLKFGYASDLFINNALINTYSKCGDIKAAHNVFDEMSFHNVVVYNTMITGWLSCGDINSARKLFDEMPDRNLETWNTLISGYCKLGQVDIARSLFDEMQIRDLFSWSTMIAGYVQSGKALEALELFNSMQFNNVHPDNVTITSALSACAQMGALDMGKRIHDYVRRKQMRNDVFLDTSLVDMYAKCGCIEIALEIFRSIKKKNLCTYNAMLSGLATHGHGFASLQLFKEMESDSVRPDEVTFVAVLSACNHIGSVEEGLKEFHRMQNEFQICPKIEHYGCIVDLLGRKGLIDEAKKLILSMPMKPNVIIWGALLNACKIHGNTNACKDVAGYLSCLDLDNGGCHILLSNILAERREWEEVEKTRKISKGDGKKTPGCSSIEVDSVVHEFFVEDRFKLQWREVSEVVKKLSSHLEEET